MTLWNDYSIKEKAALIRKAVANGITNLDDIQANVNKYKDGGDKSKFSLQLALALEDNEEFNTELFIKYFTDLAERESGFRENIENSIKAKGYFQLMPFNLKSGNLFKDMFALTSLNLKYLLKNLTDEDMKRAAELNIDIYGLLAGMHLGGKNAIKALRGKGNAKDSNGTSVLDYMTRFSQINKASENFNDNPILQYLLLADLVLMLRKNNEEEVYPLMKVLLSALYELPDDLGSYLEDNDIELVKKELSLELLIELKLSLVLPITLSNKQWPSYNKYLLDLAKSVEDSLNNLKPIDFNISNSSLKYALSNSEATGGYLLLPNFKGNKLPLPTVRYDDGGVLDNNILLDDEEEPESTLNIRPKWKTRRLSANVVDMRDVLMPEDRSFLEDFNSIVFNIPYYVSKGFNSLINKTFDTNLNLALPQYVDRYDKELHQYKLIFELRKKASDKRQNLFYDGGPEEIITIPALPLFNTPRTWSTYTPLGELYYREHYDPNVGLAYSIYDSNTNTYRGAPLLEVVVSASMPEEYKNNKEMQKRDGESGEEYTERISKLNRERATFKEEILKALNEGAKLTAAALAAPALIATSPTLASAAMNLMANPVVETAFGIDAIHRQLGEDGYKKTLNYIKEGDWRALPSFGGDLLDLTMLGAGARGAYKTIDGAYDLAKLGFNFANRNYVYPYRISKSIDNTVDEGIEYDKWLDNLNTNVEESLKYYGPIRAKRKATFLGDIYPGGAYPYSSRTLLTDLTNKDIYRIANSQTRTSGVDFPSLGKIIHLDATGPLPVNSEGLIPKLILWGSADGTIASEPRIWWYKDRPFYNGEFADNGFAYVIDRAKANNLDPIDPFKGSIVKTTNTPFSDIDYALRYDPLTGAVEKHNFVNTKSLKSSVPESSTIDFTTARTAQELPDLGINTLDFSNPLYRGALSKVIEHPTNSNILLKQGKPLTKEELDLQIALNKALNESGLVLPTEYMGATESNGLYTPIWQLEKLPTTFSKEAVFNPETGKLRSAEERISLEKESLKVLQEIYDLAIKNGATIEDGRIILPDGSRVFDFGNMHNIGRTSDGRAVIFDAKYKPTVKELSTEEVLDDAYMKAVQEGDMKTALALRDLHFTDTTLNMILNKEALPFSNISSNLSKKTSLAFYERPSTLSEAEKAGIPKGERNLVPFDNFKDFPREDIRIKDKDGNLISLKTNLEYPIFNENLLRGQYYFVNGVAYRRGKPGMYEIKEDFLKDRPLIQSLDRDRTKRILDAEYNRLQRINHPNSELKDFSEILSKYASTLPTTDIKTSPFAKNDWINYIKEFYINKGYDISKVDPKDLVKIIEENYRQLNAGSTGQLKGRIFWNGNPDRLIMTENGPSVIREGVVEEFEHAPKGNSIRTSDVDNHGIYFGTQPFTLYSYPVIDKRFNGFMKTPTIGRPDMLPYMINDITTLYEQLPAGLKGEIPKNSLLYSEVKGNRAYEYINPYFDEIAVGIGTPMKSLFPHPEAFIQNEDGTVSLIRNWEDSRLHYKQGGKLLSKSLPGGNTSPSRTSNLFYSRHLGLKNF